MFGLVFLCLVPLIIFAGAVYGDYKQEGKLPWRKRGGENSGAKFG